jgi:hypothetical protein
MLEGNAPYILAIYGTSRLTMIGYTKHRPVVDIYRCRDTEFEQNLAK